MIIASFPPLTRWIIVAAGIDKHGIGGGFGPDDRDPELGGSEWGEGGMGGLDESVGADGIEGGEGDEIGLKRVGGISHDGGVAAIEADVKADVHAGGLDGDRLGSRLDLVGFGPEWHAFVVCA
jgi:hypothetical protein